MVSQFFNKKNFVFLMFFVLAKGIVFITPVFLAEYLIASDYGLIEYALSGLGILVGSIFSLGMEGAYPYYYLKQQNFSILNGFSLHPLLISFVFLLNLMGYFIFGLYALEYFMSINIAYIVANQLIYSTILKSHEKNTIAVILDGGVYVILLIGLILGLVFSVLSYQFLSYALIIYAIVYFTYACYIFFKAEKELIVKHYKQIVKYSYHVLFSSFLIFFITVSARLSIKEFLGEESVGIYSYFYRLSAIVVMIHQVVNIVFFTKIYTLNPRILDRYFAMFLLGIFMLSLLFFLLTPLILPHFLDYYKQNYAANQTIFLLLSAQMSIWIATALLSNIITRENVLLNNNIYLSMVIGFGFLALYLLRNDLNLLILTILHYTVFLATFLTQYISLLRKRIFFHKTLVVIASIFVFSLFALLFYI